MPCKNRFLLETTADEACKPGVKRVYDIVLFWEPLIKVRKGTSEVYIHPSQLFTYQVQGYDRNSFDVKNGIEYIGRINEITYISSLEDIVRICNAIGGAEFSYCTDEKMLERLRAIEKEIFPWKFKNK